MNVKYVRSINVTSFFFKQNIRKGALRTLDLEFSELAVLCFCRYPSGPYSSRDMPGKHNKTDESVTDFTKVL